MHRFWDVETYDNFFCAGFMDDTNFLDMFYIVQNPDDAMEVQRACADSGFEYKLHDLTKDASVLRKYMENPIPSTGGSSLLADFLGTSEVEVKKKEDWYFAYNSLNYDIPMIDYVLSSVMGNRTRVSTEALRRFSNKLIESDRCPVDISAYAKYGNHCDIAFLNEKKIDGGRPTIGLKTLVGILGGSIIESDSNKSGHSDDIYNDTVYNINDIVQLKETVFPAQLRSVFKVRKGLLDRFPKLARNGITINSRSAQFVEGIVAPDGPIDDTDVVTYMYPAKHIADKLGVPQTDVLEDTREWYMENVYYKIAQHDIKAANEHLAKFQSIYEFYASFRGRNWNTSTRHIFEHGIQPNDKLERVRQMRTFGTILPFIDKFGVESPSYAQFSIGGIHGAELNEQQLKQDREFIRTLKEKYGYISKIPKTVRRGTLFNLMVAQSRTCYNGYPQRYSHEIPYFLERTEASDEIVDPDQFTPYMAKRAKANKGDIPDDMPLLQEQVLDRYKFTSSGRAVHQDFVGYYPLLLINLGAFYDGKGHDPYNEVYDLRVKLKGTLKSMVYGSPIYDETNVEQEGYKLILNSASGVLDGGHDTNLRANNKAIAMRVIGQLFTWRIGQALALEGAIIPSSNTDGIYALNIDIETNRKIVDHELKRLYIDIDPEDMFLVSKDSNNRMEIVEGKVTSARGGTLTSWRGARVDNSLAHPALVDRILTDYLQEADLMKPVDLDIIRKNLRDYAASADRRHFVYMASWVMRSTSGSIFVDSESNVHKGTIRTWLSNDGVRLMRYNTRVAKRGETTDEYAKELFSECKFGNPDVVRHLSDLGVLDEIFPKAITTQEYWNSTSKSIPVIGETKVQRLSDTAKVFINNHSINEMSDEDIDTLFENIEMEEYVALIADFASTWHNEILPSI